MRSGDEVEEEEENLGGVVKRVFLSRGWGPGGYNTPPPLPSPPHRLVRRPPGPPQVPETRSVQTLPPPLTTGKSMGGARFAALVSAARQRPLPSQPKASSRRFHSIFTSGTWRPLGKRGNHSHPFKAPYVNFLKDNLDEDRNDYLDDKTKVKGQVLGNSVRTMEPDEELNPNRPKYQVKLGFENKDVPLPRHQGKRSGVFASHGWGAGGSGTPSSHPWTSLSPPSNMWGSHITPGMRDLADWHGNQPKNSRDGQAGRGESHSAIGDRHLVSFRGNTPLFHLFLSHGWGPMGR
ncbi:hypothetical protein Pmani_018665 [Petrolisthes manimaculis]|uniref:Uncharacterized protein n=1 Tax=Petrolisthes manimaculis TaxID=1843537 RepID=A0AAE1U4P7_9EUCA|nr:hypothetical protein Pmani_018665 [Petrolisthes manimaculis]